MSYPKLQALSGEQSAPWAWVAFSLRLLWNRLGGQGGLRHLMEKPFPIWQPAEVSSAYALLVRLPILLQSSELADQADRLAAGKKQGTQRYKDPGWGHLRAPDLREGMERTLGQWGKRETSKVEKGFFSRGAEGWSGEGRNS